MNHRGLWEKFKNHKFCRRFFDKLFRHLNRFAESVYLRRLKLFRHHKCKMRIDKPRILIYLHKSGIGNAIEATPLIQAIRALWPSSSITVLFTANELFDGWSIPDRVVRDEREIAGVGFDYTFFPYWGWRGIPENSITCSLGHICVVRPWFNKWFLRPEREYNMDMIRKLGYYGLTPPLYVSMKKPNMGISFGRLNICIAPCGANAPRWQNKRWPYYDQLIEGLIDKIDGVRIFVLGTKEDFIPEKVFERSEVSDLRGMLTLPETAWVMKNSHFVVGNDCGPMHIADAVQSRGIVLFGPTCELKNGPMHKIIVMCADSPCRPCQYSNRLDQCSSNDCMQDISPERVLRKIFDMLED
jgi:heptosyltransferase-3